MLFVKGFGRRGFLSQHKVFQVFIVVCKQAIHLVKLLQLFSQAPRSHPNSQPFGCSNHQQKSCTSSMFDTLILELMKCYWVIWIHSQCMSFELTRIVVRSGRLRTQCSKTQKQFIVERIANTRCHLALQLMFKSGLGGK